MARKLNEDIYAIYDDPELSEEYFPEETGNGNASKKKKKKSHRARNLFLGSLAVLLVVLASTGLLKQGVNRIISHFAGNYITENLKTFTEETGVTLTYNFTVPETIPEGYAYDKDIINILLVGVEAINSSDPYVGRSDTMMLASFNTTTGEIRLVSFLRDTYVSIEGHDANKLNASYAFGSMDLLVDTISKTGKLYINGVCLVNFDDFEEVIDTLGGVDITLSELEAEYLCSTNYISEKENRTVTAGLNHLNGNQALGYARIRKVEKEYEGKTYYNDFGRTIRQRELVKSIFEAYKNYPKTKLLSVTGEILGSVVSNLSEEQVEYLLNAYLENPGQEVTSMQFPVKGYYEGETKSCGECLVIDEEANVAFLHHFLYGTELPEELIGTEE